MKKNVLNTIMMALVISFVGCSKKEDPKPINENEMITTVKLTLTPEGGTDPIIFTSKDNDGSGPNPPVITSGDIKANTTYNGIIEFLNETKNPVEDMTEEIKKENIEHQAFYVFKNKLVTVSYKDKDKNGDNLGLEFSFKTAATTGEETLTVSLLHGLDKTKTGANHDDPNNAGGSTDVKAIFAFKVVN